MERFFKTGKGYLSSGQLGLTVAFNFLIFFLFIFNKVNGIGITFFQIAHLGPLLFTTNNKSKFFYAKMLLSILLSVFLWLRADGIINTLSLLTIISLNIVIFQEARSGELVKPLYLLKLPFVWIEKIVHYSAVNVRLILSWLLKLGVFKGILKSEVFKKIVVGGIISIPILFILIILFSSADQNFGNIFVELFKKIRFVLDLKWLKNIDLVFEVLIKSLFFWLYLCLVFPYKEIDAKADSSHLRYVIEKITVGVLVAGIFAIFIVTQFKSIGFILNGFSTGKINPSIFVREGFFQLLISCIVGLGVFNALKKDLAKHFITLFLLIEIFLVSLVAGERVWLYQYQFGLTQARVWGVFSLLFLVTFIVVLFLNLKNKVDDYTKWQICILSFSFIVFCAGLVNIDKLISTYKPPVVEGKIDVSYMARNLSWDAAPLWTDGLKDTKTGDLEYKYTLAKNLNQFLASNSRGMNIYNLNVAKICEIKTESWLNTNLSISKNRKEICENYQTWMNFKLDYELTHGITDKQNVVNYNSNSNQPFYSCRTLGTKMIIGSDGKGQIGCDIEVNGQINLENSYCEGQKTLSKKLLVPDYYQRSNRYYATLTGLELKEEVKVYAYTFTGAKVECLPSLNK